MRASNSQRPWYPRSTTLVLSSLFLLFIVFPESLARSARKHINVETAVSVDKREVIHGDDIVAGVEEAQRDKDDSILSERIKTEIQNIETGGIAPDRKLHEKQEVQLDKEPSEKIEKISSAGIRRFDAEVVAEESDSAVPEKVKVNPKEIHIGSETHVEVSEVKVNVLQDQEDVDKEVVQNQEKQEENFKRSVGLANQSKISNSASDTENKQLITNNPDGLGKYETLEQESETLKQGRDIPELESEPQNSAPPRIKINYTMIELLKREAAILQQQIRDKTLFERIKERTFVIPEIPVLSEMEILESLKSISTTKDRHDISIEPLSNHLLSDKQVEIIQYSAQLLAENQKQSFFSSMYDCVRNLSVTNCMQIFVYPILADAVPHLILQNIPGLPIEVDVSDLIPNRPNRTKSARASSFWIYPLVTTEETVTDILRDILKNQRLHGSVPSYIDPLNETFIKLLSPRQLKILQMAEKLLPVSSRREYSDSVYSCIQRFEYFSCLKYYAWPMIKKDYSALPDFPDYQIWYPNPAPMEHPIFPSPAEYPIYPFSMEQGQLPEVIEADMDRYKARPGALILRILRDGIKPGGTQPAGLFMPFNQPVANASEIDNKSEPTPENQLQLEQMIKILPFQENLPVTPARSAAGIRIPQDQLNAVHVARQILPPQLRAEFTSKSLKCIREVNYYDCMKYYTWPIVRQVQPTLPQFPDLWELFQLPNLSQFFQIPNLGGIFQFPGIGGFGPPSFPTIPFFPGVPTIPTIPTVPGAPTIPTIPGAPAIPTIPGAPTIPTIPEVPTIPVTPAEASTVILRDAQRIQMGLPTINPGEAMKVPVEGEPIESNSEEQTNQPSEKAASDSQELPKTPLIQISSRTSEKPSNVPIVSITGTEFVPILSENPETVIFTILRLYQISDPSLMNTLAIPFLNSSTSEYTKFLSLHQENTILLAKSILPESARSSFSEQMISCVRDKDFVTCSREVMFPTLSEFFPNLPSFPNFGSSQNPQELMKPNSTEPISDNQQISETNVKTDKHGDATVTITDTRFIPIFSEHPEGVVMNILRAVLISNPNLSAGSLKTREIINSGEFENRFSEEQIMTIEIAESLLPGEERDSFVKRMIECTRDNEFLDCTRDIAFPSIAKYYPNLPNFPNFMAQAGASSSNPQDSGSPASIQLLRGLQQPEIDAHTAYLQQVENHLQNEIENILIRSVSVNERPEAPAANNADIPLQTSPGLLSKQQKNIMRLSERILPESIRPAYHAKIAECINSNSFVYCMQNVGWPLLRLNPLLLNPPPKPFPKVLTGLQPVSTVNVNGIQIPEYEAPFENIGGHKQQGEAAPDITSSVGRQAFPPEIPAYAGQPTASFVDVFNERVDPEKPQEQIKPISQEHNRKKRSPVNLLGSYPEHDPDKNKGSVRKNLLKPAFPNMTEFELLQLLTQIKNSKNDQLRNSPDLPHKYFVDTVDPESKKTLTADQVQILRLVEDLNPETTRGFLSQLLQCIRGLSLIRCAGIFIWPMVASNIPVLSAFSGRYDVGSEFQEIFGMPRDDFEKELMVKKQEFEDVLLSWYKTLMEHKFETNVGFLKIKGHGNGELGISLAGFREGRVKIVKDNKHLPSILTIISEIMEDVLESKPNPNKNKKDPKKSRNIRFEDSNYQTLRHSEEDSKMEKSMKDDRILVALLEKLRTNDSDTRNNEYGQYFSIQDAYKAFELLFGTKLTSEIGSRLKSFSEDHLRSFMNRNVEEEEPIDDELKIIPLEAQEKILEEKLKIVPLKIADTFYNFDEEIGKAYDVEKELSKEHGSLKDQEKLKIGFKDGSLIRNKKHRNELSIRLPRLNEIVISRKITSDIINMGRGLKSKMMQMMPGIGIAISFLIQMAIAHARTAASVAGIMSNMALGMGLFSMVRDAFFGQPNHPKVKYVYDTDTPDPGVSWPKNPNFWK